MAVRCATSADFLSRTTGLLPTSGARTVMLWARQTVIPTAGGYNTYYAALNSTPELYDAWGGLFSDNNDTPNAALSIDLDAIWDASAAVNVWRHHAWVTSGTTQSYYINGTLKGSITVDLSALTVITEVVGGDSWSAGDVEIAYVRQWDAALDADAIAAEMVSATAIRTTNLWLDTPLTSDLADTS